MENNANNSGLKETIQETSKEQSIVPPIVPTPPKSKLPLVFLVIFLLFLFGAGGIFIVKNFYAPQTLVPMPTFAPKPTLTLTANFDTTTNWKTYTNNIFSYTLKYPENWEYNVVSEDANCCSQIVLRPISNSAFNQFKEIGLIRIQVNKSNLNLDSALNELCQAWKCVRTNFVNSTLGGLSAKKILSPTTLISEAVLARVETQDKVKNGYGYTGNNFTITLDNPSGSIYSDLSLDEKEKIFNLMLSNFKVLNQTPTSVSLNTKIYSSTQYSFTFQYPDNYYVFEQTPGVPGIYFISFDPNEKPSGNNAKGLTLDIEVHQTYDQSVASFKTNIVKQTVEKFSTGIKIIGEQVPGEMGGLPRRVAVFNTKPNPFVLDLWNNDQNNIAAFDQVAKTFIILSK